MSEIVFYQVEQDDDFYNDVRRLTRKKGFRKLPGQILELEEQLTRGEFPGTLIRSTTTPKPYDLYKLRMPNLDTKEGKSNGYRIYYIVVTEQRIIVLLTIYYKKENEIVSDIYIDGLIDGFFIDSIPLDDKDTGEI
jgi:mRNA-degrading endonuclease RelE of RelBE toxin-antitoxin system